MKLASQRWMEFQERSTPRGSAKEFFVLLAILLVSLFCVGPFALSRWFAAAEDRGSLPESIRSKSAADYSTDPLARFVPVINLDILRELLEGVQPQDGDGIAWLGTLTATQTDPQSTPIPTDPSGLVTTATPTNQSPHGNLGTPTPTPTVTVGLTISPPEPTSPGRLTPTGNPSPTPVVTTPIPPNPTATPMTPTPKPTTNTPPPITPTTPAPPSPTTAVPTEPTKTPPPPPTTEPPPPTTEPPPPTTEPPPPTTEPPPPTTEPPPPTTEPPPPSKTPRVTPIFTPQRTYTPFPTKGSP